MSLKKLRNLSIASALFLLAGCLHSTKPPIVSIESVRQSIPKNLLERCDLIRIIRPVDTPEEEVNMGDLLTYTTTLYSDYTECALRYDQLIKVITEKTENEKQ